MYKILFFTMAVLLLFSTSGMSDTNDQQSFVSPFRSSEAHQTVSDWWHSKTHGVDKTFLFDREQHLYRENVNKTLRHRRKIIKILNFNREFPARTYHMTNGCGW